MLTIFGAASVATMLVCYAFEERSPVFVLMFGGACWASAFYAALAGAWPFAVIELIWGIIAIRRFVVRKRSAQ